MERVFMPPSAQLSVCVCARGFLPFISLTACVESLECLICASYRAVGAAHEFFVWVFNADLERRWFGSLR
ncbi:hypothetical protein BDU57DRAFT_294704 [Ampelomyces quisqualis]|uniref:Uncharacterized protein n=1 Tax=Ampelomyces quisqualis TaxID=50730 RepID=A0A6A5QK44_AMPQU|nr:hypothetical protein BDU57DRAFT_294704 [Ampelomyces quisqualis]